MPDAWLYDAVPITLQPPPTESSTLSPSVPVSCGESGIPAPLQRPSVGRRRPASRGHRSDIGAWRCRGRVHRERAHGVGRGGVHAGSGGWHRAASVGGVRGLVPVRPRRPRCGAAAAFADPPRGLCGERPSTPRSSTSTIAAPGTSTLRSADLRAPLGPCVDRSARGPYARPPTKHRRAARPSR